jgi:phosphate transport system substrate-binding protein
VAALGSVASCTSQQADQVAGSLRVGGSPTLEALTAKVSEQFLGTGNTTKIDISPASTDTAVSRFCAGRLDVLDVSRSMTAHERTACRQAGVEYRRIRVANDAIVLVANPRFGLSCVGTKTLKTWWAASSDGTVTTWKQLQPGRPDLSMDLYGPGPGSGTYEVFAHLVEGPKAELRHDFTVTPTEAIAIAAVSRYRSAAGFVSYPTYDHAATKVSAVAIDDGHGCVTPSVSTVQDESYLLSRPLYLYVSVSASNKRPAVREFVRYYVEHARALAKELHYVPLTLGQARQSMQSAVTARTGG